MALVLISYSCHGFSIDLVLMSWIWANLGLGPKTISFIQGQTLISAKAPHGGYPWRVDLGLILDNFEWRFWIEKSNHYFWKFEVIKVRSNELAIWISTWKPPQIKHGKNKISPIWANLGLGPKTISFIQGQTLISAEAPHGGYPWRVDLGLILDNFE